MSLTIKTWTVGPFATNCYLVADDTAGEAVLFDAGLEPQTLIQGIEAADVRLKVLINTHAHIDHVAGNRAVVDGFGVPLWMHETAVPLLQSVPAQAQMFGVEAEASPEPDALLAHGDAVYVGDFRFEVRHTPGHSPGGLTFYCAEAQVAIVGDTVFAGSIGRTDLPGADFDVLARAIREQIYTLPEETTLYPGHMGTTTVGREKTTNPFVRA